MYGIILGDIIGSPYEGGSIKGYGLPLLTDKSTLTDDTIIALATADVLQSPRTAGLKDFSESYRSWVSRYKGLGFSPDMLEWVDNRDKHPLMEGNGAGIRAAVIGLQIEDRELAERLLVWSVRITHSDEAKSLAALLMASIMSLKAGASAEKVLAWASERNPMLSLFDYDVYQQTEHMDTTLWWTMPAAMHIGLTADSYSDLFARVLHIGGDTDSIGAMAGAIAQARWGLKGITAEMARAIKDRVNALANEEDKALYLKSIEDIEEVNTQSA